MENWITRDGGLGLGGWRTGRGFIGGFTGPLTETFSPERFERAKQLRDASIRGEWARDEMEGFGEMIWNSSGTSYTGSWQR